MCGVIVVDAESFRSTCLGPDAYIHDHCLDMLITMLNSNLFTHRRIFMLLREATSETYGPGSILIISISITLLLALFLLCLLLFTLHLSNKNTKNIIYHVY